MNLTKRVSWGIHITMGCVYLGIIGSHLAGRYETRNVILLSGIAFWGLALLICGMLWIIGRGYALAQVLRGRSAAAGRRQSASRLDLLPRPWSRRHESPSYPKGPGALR
jgi:hypothetical protein